MTLTNLVTAAAAICLGIAIYKLNSEPTGSMFGIAASVLVMLSVVLRMRERRKRGVGR